MVSLVRHEINYNSPHSEKAVTSTSEHDNISTLDNHKVILPGHSSAVTSPFTSPTPSSNSGSSFAREDSSRLDISLDHALRSQSTRFDDSTFLVSGPLLPIRHSRRGANPNRNYRIIDTHAFMASGLYREGIGSAAASPVTSLPLAASHVPPAPIPDSAVASKALRAATENSFLLRANESVPGLDSGSNKSVTTSVSTANSVSDTVSNSDGILSGKTRQIRLYDKHQALEVHELPMPNVTLPKYTHPNVRLNKQSPTFEQTHSLELDGRSGTVRVSTLLPGARRSPTQPQISIHPRKPLPQSNSQHTPQFQGQKDLTTTDTSVFVPNQQHFLVQRLSKGQCSPNQCTPCSGQITISSSESRSKSQRLHLNIPTDSHFLNENNEPPRNNINDVPTYFADSEMNGDSIVTMQPAGKDAVSDKQTLERGRSANVVRNSWNMLSMDEDSVLTERQKKRMAVRASVTTEKFYVRTVSPTEIVNTNGIPTPTQLEPLPISSPNEKDTSGSGEREGDVDQQKIWAESPSIPAELYQESSADEIPTTPHNANNGSSHKNLDQSKRASSFDFGSICHSSGDYGSVFKKGVITRGTRSSPRISVRSLFPDVKHSSSDSQLSRPGTHSIKESVRHATFESKETRLEEAGYDGDSEGATGSNPRILAQRRNTVAGDKINDMLDQSNISPGAKLPRNTGDFSDMMHGREERRSIRAAHRKSTTRALMPFGTQISPGHANYVLMFNMLTGIRVSVSRCEANEPRPVDLNDYTAAHKYSFDVVGDEMTPSSRYDFKFKDYAPWVFRCIRETFHLSTEDYLVSLTEKYILSEVGSSGKSGSFFYYSQDYRFIIKTVRRTEHKFMRQILPQYYEFVRDNPNTMLSRIYGLHRIKLPQGRKVHFIVMSNILPPNKDIHAQFDLKGSMYKRELDAEAASRPRACMKDKNWVKMQQRLHLGPTKRREFVKQLIKDVELLIRLNIMDYSLLVGIHDITQGNTAKLRDTTLSMFDPQTADIQQLNRLTRAHTIRKKVVHTDPIALDSLPFGTAPPLPQSMFKELRHSIFYREDGGILSTNEHDNPAQFIYYLGVIDILTPYNMVKRTEHIVKSIVHDGSQVSAVNPRKYGLRFLRFMIRALSNCKDVLPLLEEFERGSYQEICREHSLF